MQKESSVGCSQTTTQDIAERIKGVTPVDARNQHAAYFPVEVFQSGESRAIDFVDWPGPDVCAGANRE